MKPTVFCFVGPSAAGKDSAACELSDLANIHVSVSSTTRPKRDLELDDIDYHFISKEQFEKGIEEGQFLEYSKFRGWYYGTLLNEMVFEDKVILVLNPQGVSTLIEKYSDKIDLHVIYLICPLGERLKRSIKREHGFKFEFIRRAVTDYFDFKHLFKNIKHIEYATNRDVLEWTLLSFTDSLDLFIFNTKNMSSLEIAEQISKEYHLNES